MLAARLRAYRRHVVAIAGEAAPFRPGDNLCGLVAVFGKAGIEEAQHGNIQSIQPYHRLTDTIDAEIAVIMPTPRRCDDEIARMHDGALAVDRGVSPLAVDDEAQRRLAM